MQNRKLYFDENKHEYQDEYSIKYTSATQLIGKYTPKFDVKKRAELCARSKKGRYKNINTTKEVLALWDRERDEALDKGNAKHNELESAVKKSSKFLESGKSTGKSVKLYTIDDILEDHSFGLLDLNSKYMLDIKKKKRRVYKVIEKFVNDGYRIYSEIGVYSSHYYVSGLIDILLVKGNDFIILDWKTNKATMIPYDMDKFKYLSGYFTKDKFGNLTNNYKLTNEYFFPPLDNLQTSTYNKYTLQLSLYAILVERFGLNYKGNVLAHMRNGVYNIGHPIVENNPEYVNTEIADIHLMPYYKNEVQLMLDDHYNKNIKGIEEATLNI